MSGPAGRSPPPGLDRGYDRVVAELDGPGRGPTSAVGLSNRLPELRAARGWTQADLARRLQVSRQTVNAIERGRCVPALTLAFQIAAVFGGPIEAVFRPRAD